MALANSGFTNNAALRQFAVAPNSFQGAFQAQPGAGSISANVAAVRAELGLPDNAPLSVFSTTLSRARNALSAQIQQVQTQINVNQQLRDNAANMANLFRQQARQFPGVIVTAQTFEDQRNAFDRTLTQLRSDLRVLQLKQVRFADAAKVVEGRLSSRRSGLLA